MISVHEYLSTTYRPDREYREGHTLQRKLGERDHSELQMAIAGFLYANRKKLGIHVFPEQRVQVSPNRFRVPDVCVVAGGKPAELVFTKPPLVCIEILSKDDTMVEIEDRIDDYLAFGVAHVWVLNPRNQKAFVCTTEGMREAKGVLRTENPAITVPLSEIFSELD